LALRARYADAIGVFSISGERCDAHSLSLLANCRVQQSDLERAEADANDALKGAAPESAARAHALHALGLIAHAKGELGKAREFYESGLAIRRRRDDLMGCYYSLASLAVLHLIPGDLAMARDCIKESHALCQRLGNESGMMMVHFLAGEVAAKEGRTKDATVNYRQSLAIEEMLHHPQHRARILISLGALLASNGDYGAAMEIHRQALELALEVGDRHRAASALLELGVDLRLAGVFVQAKARLVEAIRIASRLRARPLLMRCLLELAQVESQLGEKARANRLASILAGAELGPLQSAYDAFVGGAPTPLARSAGTPETVALELVEEADLAALLL
jgi:tetratricopeptide (TPR) repeat protein